MSPVSTPTWSVAAGYFCAEVVEDADLELVERVRAAAAPAGRRHAPWCSTTNPAKSGSRHFNRGLDAVLVERGAAADHHEVLRARLDHARLRRW